MTNSDVVLKAGIQRVGLEFLKPCDKTSSKIVRIPALTTLQALEFGDIEQMADKAALFKSVSSEPLQQRSSTKSGEDMWSNLSAASSA